MVKIHFAKDPKPEGTGVVYAKCVRSKKEELHFHPKIIVPKDPKDLKEGEVQEVQEQILSNYTQDWKKYTYSQIGIWTSVFHPQCGQPTVIENSKQPSMLGRQTDEYSVPAIVAAEGSEVEHAHYINGLGLHIAQLRQYLVSNLNLMQADSHQTGLYLEMTGKIDEFAPVLAIKRSVEELIEAAKREQTVSCPWFGNFAMQHSAATNFPVNCIGSFKCLSKITLRPLSELIVNRFKTDAKDTASFIIPKVVGTAGKNLKKDSIIGNLISRYTWLEEFEENIISENFREIKFKPLRKIGEATFDSCSTTTIQKVHCEVTGCASQLFLTVAPNDEVGPEYQTTNNNGEHFIETAYLLLNNRCHSDPVSAEFMSKNAFLDSWGFCPKRTVYLVSDFEQNPSSQYFSGGLILTGFSSVEVAVKVKPHAFPLKARVDILMWQA